MRTAILRLRQRLFWNTGVKGGVQKRNPLKAKIVLVRHSRRTGKPQAGKVEIEAMPGVECQKYPKKAIGYRPIARWRGLFFLRVFRGFQCCGWYRALYQTVADLC